MFSHRPRVTLQRLMKRHRWVGHFLRFFTGYVKRINVADAGPSTYDRLGFRVPAVIVSPFDAAIS